MRFHPDVLAAHAQFGGDLEDMQRKYDAPSQPEDVERVVERAERIFGDLEAHNFDDAIDAFKAQHAVIQSLSIQLAEAKAERDKQKERLFRQIDFTGELQRLLWALSQGNDLPETIKDSHAYNVASIVKADLDRLAAALRSIAEGNLGDDPWQAGYAKIKEVARAALASLEDR